IRVAALPQAGVAPSVRAFPWTFAIWGSGAALLLARLAIGIARIAWITRTATVKDGIRYSPRVSTPLTWASFIVVPRNVSDDIVIRHERAHLARHDWWWQTFAAIVNAVFWFHPLVWFANARLRLEAEQAADDLVLASGTPASEYAEKLLRIGRRMRGGAPACAVAMVPVLESRVRNILEARQRTPAGSVARAAIALAALMLIIPIAGQEPHRIGEKGLLPPKVLSKVEPQY